MRVDEEVAAATPADFLSKAAWASFRFLVSSSILESVYTQSQGSIITYLCFERGLLCLFLDSLLPVGQSDLLIPLLPLPLQLQPDAFLLLELGSTDLLVFFYLCSFFLLLLFSSFSATLFELLSNCSFLIRSGLFLNVSKKVSSSHGQSYLLSSSRSELKRLDVSWSRLEAKRLTSNGRGMAKHTTLTERCSGLSERRKTVRRACS